MPRLVEYYTTVEQKRVHIAQIWNCVLNLGNN